MKGLQGPCGAMAPHRFMLRVACTALYKEDAQAPGQPSSLEVSGHQGALGGTR